MDYCSFSVIFHTIFFCTKAIVKEEDLKEVPNGKLNNETKYEIFRV